jgi:glycosyltransferase involved in cell wall biosynthesis
MEMEFQGNDSSVPREFTSPRKLCFVLNNLGEYHVARLNRAAAVLAPFGVTIVVIEASTGTKFYTHRQRRGADLLRGVGHVQMRSAGRRLATETDLWRRLANERPSHIFTIGYSDRLSLTALAYARFHRLPAIFMGDSKADDQPRNRRGEWLKSLILRGFSGALVAGQRHRDYFRSLGMKQPIELGFDVIDNEFFAKQAQRWRRRSDGLIRRGIITERYVLCVSRLVERKRVGDAFAIFAASGLAREGVRFVLIGSGPLCEELLARATSLGIADSLCHYPDIRNSVMPLFYAQATALILASEYDQWGLCVNEAQAIGVPCLVTRRCGVAGEIVHDGDNGCVFTPDRLDHAAKTLHDLFTQHELRSRWSLRSVETMKDWGLDRFASSVGRLCGVFPAPSH